MVTGRFAVCVLPGVEGSRSKWLKGAFGGKERLMIIIDIFGSDDRLRLAAGAAVRRLQRSRRHLARRPRHGQERNTHQDAL